MGEPKRKPGRPPKHIGLATPASLKQVVDGNALRDLRGTEPLQEGPVLPEAPADSPAKAGVRGVFGAVANQDGQRGREAVRPPLLDPPGREAIEDDGELKLSLLFRQLLREVAAPEFQDNDEPMTNAEILARGILRDALKGDKAAREMVVDRVEGKAVRGEKVQSADMTVEDQVDAATVALLNGLTPAEKDIDNA